MYDGGRVDTTFAVVQALEFIGGAANIRLLSLSARRLLTAVARRRKRQAASGAAQA